MFDRVSSHRSSVKSSGTEKPTVCRASSVQLLKTLGDQGIDISSSQSSALIDNVAAFLADRQPLHAASALWFARTCLTLGDADLFRNVVITFNIKRLQGVREGAEIVACTLQDLPEVHQIEFSAGGKLTQACVDGLANALSRPRTGAPFELDLHSCAIESSVLESFAARLPGMQALKMLSIMNCKGPNPDLDRGITALGNAVAHSAQLQSFKLVVHGMREPAAREIGKGVRQNRSLVEVHVAIRAGENPNDRMTEFVVLTEELARRDAIDPAQPGRAAPALATLVLLGPRAERGGEWILPSQCTARLIDIVNDNPLLTRVRIRPKLTVENPRACEGIFKICNTRQMHFDVGLYRVPHDIWTTDTAPWGAKLKPPRDFIRRTDPSHLLRTLSPHAALNEMARLLLELQPAEVSLPDEVWPLIAGYLLEGRFRAALRCINSNAVQATRNVLNTMHAERAKSLITVSAFAFGHTELAHLLMGSYLAGIPMSRDQERQLQQIVDTERPDAAALKATVNRRGRHMLDRWKEQEALLSKYGYGEDFDADHGRRIEFQQHFPDITGSPWTISTRALSSARERQKFRNRATETIETAFAQFTSWLSSPRRKSDEPSDPSGQKD